MGPLAMQIGDSDITAAGTRLAAIMAVVAHFNAIGEGLATASDRRAPTLEKTDGGLAWPVLSGLAPARPQIGGRGSESAIPR
jgi:hypothetical protein